MQNAIFNIKEYENEIITVSPEQLRPAKKFDFDEHKRRTKFYNQKKREDDKNILVACILALSYISICYIGVLAKEPFLGAFILGAVLLICAANRFGYVFNEMMGKVLVGLIGRRS